MKIVAVTRILNEEDIVEAFVRHHATMVDHHLLLDDGSVDRTIEILRSLKDEGLDITVLRSHTPFYNEVDFNSGLYHQAAHSLGADWVLCLDTDEFIDTRRTAAGLRAHLAAIAPDVDYLFIPSVSYFDVATDDATEPLVPRRMRQREAYMANPVMKVFIRGTLVGPVVVDAGQHDLAANEMPRSGRTDASLVLAHYFRRGPWQFVTKNVMGHLKVLAAGESGLAQNRSAHYTGPFHAIRDHAHQYLRDPNFLQPSYSDLALIDDPIRYEGSPLRYTYQRDAAMTAVQILASYGEHLAIFAGHLLDANAELGARIRENAANCEVLF